MITIPKLRELTGIGGSMEAQLPALRDLVVSMWELETGLLWDLRVGHVEVVEPDTDRIQTIFLSLRPATTITKVRENALEEGAEWEDVEVAKYMLIGDRRLRRLSDWWGPLVEVTYTGGVEEATEEIQKALATQARFLLDRLSGDRIVSRQLAVAQAGTAQYEQADLHPFFKALARRHARTA